VIISVASGKGGTGKTTVACSLAALKGNCTYLDCDVEEPNGALFLNPEISNEEKVYKLIPEIDYSKCSLCGKCAELCEFNALLNFKKEILIFNELCHSCGVCSFFCPEKAINETQKEIGIIRKGFADNNINFADGLLNLGEPSSVPVIKQVKKQFNSLGNVIIDSPPGTSCAMLEAVKNSDYCIIVTESTPFGFSDLKLAVEVLNEVGLPFGIVINKYEESFQIIEDFAKDNNIEILLKIPLSMEIAESYSKGIIPLFTIPFYKNLIDELYLKIKNKLSIDKRI